MGGFDENWRAQSAARHWRDRQRAVMDKHLMENILLSEREIADREAFRDAALHGRGVTRVRATGDEITVEYVDITNRPRLPDETPDAS